MKKLSILLFIFLIGVNNTFSQINQEKILNRLVKDVFDYEYTYLYGSGWKTYRGYGPNTETSMNLTDLDIKTDKNRHNKNMVSKIKIIGELKKDSLYKYDENYLGKMFSNLVIINHHKYLYLLKNNLGIQSNEIKEGGYLTSTHHRIGNRLFVGKKYIPEHTNIYYSYPKEILTEDVISEYYSHINSDEYFNIKKLLMNDTIKIDFGIIVEVEYYKAKHIIGDHYEYELNKCKFFVKKYKNNGSLYWYKYKYNHYELLNTIFDTTKRFSNNYDNINNFILYDDSDYINIYNYEVIIPKKFNKFLFDKSKSIYENGRTT